MPADVPYRDPALPTDRRVEDLFGRMTLPEKVGQMLQLDARRDLKDAVSTRLAGSILHASPQRMLEAIDMAANTRLGIPLITAEDCIHGHGFWPGATVFPTQLAMAATWDAGLAERGHRVERATLDPAGFGHAHLIEVTDEGMRAGAADVRSVIGAAIATA